MNEQPQNGAPIGILAPCGSGFEKRLASRREPTPVERSAVRFPPAYPAVDTQICSGATCQELLRKYTAPFVPRGSISEL